MLLGQEGWSFLQTSQPGDSVPARIQRVGWEERRPIRLGQRRGPGLSEAHRSKSGKRNQQGDYPSPLLHQIPIGIFADRRRACNVDICVRLYSPGSWRPQDLAYWKMLSGAEADSRTVLRCQAEE
jgi:hypothetical protein